MEGPSPGVPRWRQVVGHSLDAAELGADSLSTELPGDAVMDEPLAQRHDFNIGGLVFQTWPLANGRRLLVFIFTRRLDGGMSDFVQSDGARGLAKRLSGIAYG